MPADQILVALIVAGAAGYLFLRARRASKKSCGDSCGCGKKMTNDEGLMPKE